MADIKEKELFIPKTPILSEHYHAIFQLLEHLDCLKFSMSPLKITMNGEAWIVDLIKGEWTHHLVISNESDKKLQLRVTTSRILENTISSSQTLKLLEHIDNLAQKLAPSKVCESLMD